MAKRKRDRSAEAEPAAPPRRVSRALLAVLAAAFGVKMAVFFAFRDHPLLQANIGLDPVTYAQLASRVAAGDVLLGNEPFFVSPLYVYFLAPIFALTGGSLAAARFVQVLLGTAAAGLLYGAARRLFGERAALVGTGLYVLAGVVSFHEVLILQAALDPFLSALFVYLLARALTRSEVSAKVNGAFALAGGALGLFALNRPNVLACGVAVALLLVLPLSSGERRLWSAERAAAFVAGMALAVAPAALRNLAVSGEPVLISSHGGLNFFIGNNPEADGIYRAVPGITPSIEGQARDSRLVAEREAGRPLCVREVSSHFARKACSWIASDPGAAARLFARKIWYTLSGDEIPLNLSFPWYREKSLALRLLAVGPGLLVPLGGAGLVLLLLGSGRLSPRLAAPWVSFAPVYILAVAAFFAATRYRLPLFAPLAIASGGAVAFALGRGQKRHLVPAALVAAFLALPALWPTRLWDGAAEEEMYLVFLEIEKGDPEAMRHAETVAPKHLDPAFFWLRVGRSFGKAGRNDEAIAALSRSHEVDPERPGTGPLLSVMLEERGLDRLRSGDAAGARSDLEAAVRVDPANAAACLNLAAVVAGEGATDRARALARQALDLRPDYEKARALLDALGGNPPTR